MSQDQPRFKGRGEPECFIEGHPSITGSYEHFASIDLHSRCGLSNRNVHNCFSDSFSGYCCHISNSIFRALRPIYIVLYQSPTLRNDDVPFQETSYIFFGRKFICNFLVEHLLALTTNTCDNRALWLCLASPSVFGFQNQHRLELQLFSVVFRGQQAFGKYARIRL